MYRNHDIFLEYDRERVIIRFVRNMTGARWESVFAYHSVELEITSWFFFSNHVVQSLFFLRSVLHYITIVCLLAFFFFIMDLSVYWRLMSQNYLVGYFCNSLPWKDRQFWIWLYRLLYCSCKNTFMCGFIVTGNEDKKACSKVLSAQSYFKYL